MSSENAVTSWPSTSNGYSARVRIDLYVDGQRIPVAQAGGGQIIFDRPRRLPESEGELIMQIDSHEQRWRVMLHPGQQPARIVAAEFVEA